MLRALLLAAALALAPAALAARDIPAPPRYYVLDEPGVLSEHTRNALGRLLIEHDQATGEQVLFAVFKSLGDEDLLGFTNKVFASWKIGKRGKDNGVLLALYWEDREVRIEVGYGLEGLLTDAKSKRIIEDFLVPELKAGRPDRAVSLAALEVLRTIESPLIESGRAEQILRAGGIRGFAPRGPRGAYGWVIWIVVGMILLSIVLNFVTAAEAHFTGGGWYRPRPWRARRRSGIFWGGMGGLGGWSSGRSGWGGGGGGGFGGFGGFGGGGGRSGGGGASGSW